MKSTHLNCKPKKKKTNTEPLALISATDNSPDLPFQLQGFTTIKHTADTHAYIYGKWIHAPHTYQDGAWELRVHFFSKEKARFLSAFARRQEKRDPCKNRTGRARKLSLQDKPAIK